MAGKYYYSYFLCRKNQKINLHNYNSVEPALEFNEKQIEVKEKLNRKNNYTASEREIKYL